MAADPCFSQLGVRPSSRFVTCGEADMKCGKEETIGKSVTFNYTVLVGLRSVGAKLNKRI